jgi:hypothetical protein
MLKRDGVTSRAHGHAAAVVVNGSRPGSTVAHESTVRPFGSNSYRFLARLAVSAKSLCWRFRRVVQQAVIGARPAGELCLTCSGGRFFDTSWAKFAFERLAQRRRGSTGGSFLTFALLAALSPQRRNWATSSRVSGQRSLRPRSEEAVSARR